MIKKILAKTPKWLQNEFKRFYFRRQIKNGRFISTEPEFNEVKNYIKKGDCVIDIGANVGHYTLKFSKLVGKNGRVISFEPVPNTFQLLAANIQYGDYANVTLINAAASDTSSNVSMSIPNYSSGMKAYYRARIVDEKKTDNIEVSVLSFAIDKLDLKQRVGLIKIDAEEHEPYVLQGLKKIIERDLPTIIIETVTEDIKKYLLELNYREQRLKNSINTIYVHYS